MNIQKHSQSLPFKVEAHEAKLLQVRDEIQNFIRLSEGLVFKKIGLDAFLGIIPVVGGIYTTIAGFWLLTQSIRVKSGLEEKLFIIVLTLADVIIGIFVVAGDMLDAFFRIHAWTGNRLIAHINYQLRLIAQTRQQLSGGNGVDLNALEDTLFRNGRTQQEQTRIQIAIAVVVILMFAGCTIAVS